MSPHFGITLVAIAFWISVCVIAVSGMAHDYRRRQLALEPLRAAIEHGQQLDPEIVARLLGQEERQEHLDPQLLQVGGIITCASAVGVALLSLFIARVFPPYHWIALGAGVLALCVGVGLLIASKVIRANGPRDAAA